MTSPSENVRSHWITFLAHLFMILVAWTVFIGNQDRYILEAHLMAQI